MSDYDVKKSLIRYQYIDDSGKYKFGIRKGYKCRNDKNQFNIRFEPLIMYGIRYVLCLNKDEVILYDRENLTYKLMGNIKNIEFDNNFIYDNKNKKVYFIYENKIYDITGYYNTKLKGKKITKINPKILGILTREEFSFHNIQEIDRIQEEEKEKNKKIEEENKRNAQLKKLQKEQEAELERRKRKEENEKREKIEALKKITEGLKILKKKGINSKEIPREHVEDIFIDVSDYKEIDKDYLEILMMIDLSQITFGNVKVSGIDFSITNLANIGIELNPQKVYNKDLSNCNFEGIFISPFANFDGVNIKGAKFSKDNDSMTLDMFNESFKYAIYDENTTYNGSSFSKIFEEMKKKNKH